MPTHYREGVPSVNRDRAGTNPSTFHTSNRQRNSSGVAIPLVYTSISQKITHGEICGYTVFKTSLRVLKSPAFVLSHNVPPIRGEIKSFSAASQRRLKFTASNANPELISQFCCTYHERAPDDGLLLRTHRNNFLTRLRQKYKGIAYIWILEFQTTRLKPHLHLFLSLPVAKDLHQFLATTWNRITSETDKHLKVHLHPKNFIPWTMGNGSYLATKYLHKENQKIIPEQYINCGRFWGASRGLVKPVQVLSCEDIANKFDAGIDFSTGEIVLPSHHQRFVYRVLRKHHEKKVRFHQKYTRKKKSTTCIDALDTQKVGKKHDWWIRREAPKVTNFKSQITRKNSSNLPFGGIIFQQIIDYLKQHYPVVPF